MSKTQGRSRNTKQWNIAEPIWSLSLQGKKKKRKILRNHMFKQNHIQASQSSGMAVSTDGRTWKSVSTANNVMGFLKKKPKIGSAAAADMMSQSVLTSVPPRERPCCRLPSLPLLLCSTPVFLWLTLHRLEHFLERSTRQVPSPGRQETNPEKPIVFQQVRELNWLAERSSKPKSWQKEGGRTMHWEEGEGICPSPFCGSKPLC